VENNLQNKKETKTNKKSFFQKNIVGVIIFGVWVGLAFIHMLTNSSRPDEAFGGLVIDIVTGAILGSIVQLVFVGLKKLFEKK